MLIDKTYFRNSISIPAGLYSDLDQYIEQYEKEVLVGLLGYVLYSEMMTAYKAVAPEIVEDLGAIPPVVGVPAVVLPEKWDRLINGYDYTVNGQSVHWNGLINSDKVSFIANYVFCKYILAKQTEMSAAGATQHLTENAEIVAISGKLTTAWNEFRRLYGYYGIYTYYPSVLNYLYFDSNNDKLYGELSPEHYPLTNQLGI